MISVITPTHNARYLLETYASLCAQTLQEWQWVLVKDGTVLPPLVEGDGRVVVVTAPQEMHGNVGALKRLACMNAVGEVVVELDHDDLLTPDALATVAGAFRSGDVDFVYSNTTEFHDGTWEPKVYSQQYGWQYRPFHWQGRALVELVGWDPSPQSFRRIYWSPNHLRAWRAPVYWSVGGHDDTLPVMDDHDLLCRLAVRVGFRRFHHIDRTLYLQRIYKDSTVATRNAEVQVAAARSYRRHVEHLWLAWAYERGLPAWDLGGGINPPADYNLEGVQKYGTVDVQGTPDLVHDLRDRWPWEDGTVGVLRASHVLEHLPDPVHSMSEAFRVLAPGGMLFLEVPSTDGRGAWQDPTHCSFWNENSMRYYTDDRWRKYLPAFQGRFQVSLNTTELLEPTVPVVRAHLIALKPPYSDRPAGAPATTGDDHGR